MRFFEKTMRENEGPDKVTMDKNSANKAAVGGINCDREVSIEGPQIKYLRNIVEQDHRTIKRITRSMMGCKSLYAASDFLVKIELMHIIHKGQKITAIGGEISFAGHFYALATNYAQTDCTLDKEHPQSSPAQLM